MDELARKYVNCVLQINEGFTGKLNGKAKGFYHIINGELYYIEAGDFFGSALESTNNLMEASDEEVIRFIHRYEKILYSPEKLLAKNDMTFKHYSPDQMQERMLSNKDGQKQFNQVLTEQVFSNIVMGTLSRFSQHISYIGIDGYEVKVGFDRYLRGISLTCDFYNNGNINGQYSFIGTALTHERLSSTVRDIVNEISKPIRATVSVN